MCGRQAHASGPAEESWRVHEGQHMGPIASIEVSRGKCMRGSTWHTLLYFACGHRGICLPFHWLLLVVWPVCGVGLRKRRYILCYVFHPLLVQWGVRGWGFSCVWLPHPLVCVLCVLLVSWLAHANWLHQALPSVPLYAPLQPADRSHSMALSCPHLLPWL